MLSFISSPFIRANRRLFSIGMFVLFAQLFIWISADYVFGPYAAAVSQVMILYFMLFLVTRVTLGGRPSAVAERGGFTNFLLVFLVTSVILVAVGALYSPLSSIAQIAEVTPVVVGVTALGFGVLYAFVKAYIEEDVFRDAIPRLSGIGDIGANILFALFHFAILVTVRIPASISAGAMADMGALNWTYALAPMGLLFGLGLLWAKVRNGFGISGSTASHFSWNLFAQGLLGAFFGGVIV